MLPTAERNPYALFAHALTERDWVLADLIGRAMEADLASRRRLLDELQAGAGTRPAAAPRSLGDLRRWAAIARDLEIDEDRG